MDKVRWRWRSAESVTSKIGPEISFGQVNCFHCPLSSLLTLRRRQVCAEALVPRLCRKLNYSSFLEAFLGPGTLEDIFRQSAPLWQLFFFFNGKDLNAAILATSRVSCSDAGPVWQADEVQPAQTQIQQTRKATNGKSER